MPKSDIPILHHKIFQERCMKKTLVEQFFQDNILPPSRKVQYSMYMAENGYVEEKYFLKIAKKTQKQ